MKSRGIRLGKARSSWHLELRDILYNITIVLPTDQDPMFLYTRAHSSNGRFSLGIGLSIALNSNHVFGLLQSAYCISGKLDAEFCQLTNPTSTDVSDSCALTRSLERSLRGRRHG
jgi:hypothetical protein